MFAKLSLFILILSIFFPSPVEANFTTSLEQQINLIDQEYHTIGTNDPSDNSLGLIRWESNQYNDKTVYFEAIIACPGCTGGNHQAIAKLYTESGDTVTDATVTTTASTYTLNRSAAITGNLTNNTNYTVRLSRDADAGTAYLKAARLIVIQGGANLTSTQTQVEIGNNASTTSNNSTIMTGVKIFRFDRGSFDPLNNLYFEVTLAGSDSEATPSAALSSAADCTTLVSGSEVTKTGSTWSRERSGDIKGNLADDTDYWVCLKASPDDTASIANAKLIINQSDTEGIMKTQVFSQFFNTVTVDSDSVYSSYDYPNEFNPDHFQADQVDYYYEVTLSAAGGTAYSRLYNVTDSIAFGSTELETSTLGYMRLRSNTPINSSLPDSTKTLDGQIRNSASNSTYTTTGWLITNLIRHPDPKFSFTLGGVNEGDSHNGITTSIGSSFDTLSFGILIPGIPRYAAHVLTVATNATSGYTVNLKMPDYLQGNFPGNNIDPFPGTWTAPQNWSTPTGTSQNSDTGWFGANTSDTRLPDWVGAAGKFAGLDTAEHSVMYSASPDAGTTVYVSYGLEVNIYQPPDTYSGTLVYNLLPNY